MGRLAALAADLRHVLTILADRFTPLPCDLALLVLIHACETAIAGALEKGDLLPKDLTPKKLMAGYSVNADAGVFLISSDVGFVRFYPGYETSLI